jgi:hypothetical protein
MMGRLLRGKGGPSYLGRSSEVPFHFYPRTAMTRDPCETRLVAHLRI